MIVACIFSVLFLLFQTKDYFRGPYKWNKDGNIEFSDGWLVQIDGKQKTYQVNLPKLMKEAEKGQWITLRKKIEKGMKYANPYLMVGSSQQAFHVSLDGKHLYSMDGMKEINYGRTSGVGWFLVKMPKNCEGKEVQIRICSSYKETAGAISKVYFGNKRDLMSELFSLSHKKLIAGIIMFLLSIVILTLNIPLKKITRFFYMGSVYLGLLVLALSVFVLVESQGLVFFFSNYAFCYYVEFIALFSFPIFLYRFIYYFYQPECSKKIWKLGEFHFVLFFLALLGQITGITDFFTLQWILLGCFGITLLTSCYFLLKEIVKNKKLITILLWLLLITLLIVFNYFAFTPKTEVAVYDLLLITVIVFILYFLLSFFYEVSRLFKIRVDNDILKEQIKQHKTHYNRLQQEKDKLRRVHHDIKYQWFTLEQLWNDSGEQAKEYLKTVVDSFKVTKAYVDTGNYLLDAILAEKLEKANLMGIEPKINIMVKKELQIELTDCSILFGNLLDNALEALEKLEADKRLLEINILTKKNLLIIKVKNSYNGIVKKVENRYMTTKEEKDFHGIGLESIQQIVKKYDGELEISYDEEFFNIGIVLYGV